VIPSNMSCPASGHATDETDPLAFDSVLACLVFFQRSYKRLNYVYIHVLKCNIRKNYKENIKFFACSA